MIQHHLRARGIRNDRLIEQFGNVPREQFIAAALVDQTYEDYPLSIGHAQTISQPFVVALMIQELDPKPTDRVLDVGAGSGYQTAILAGLAGRVWAVERVDDLARRAERALKQLGIENATVHVGDGTLGWPAEAPFDRIICGAAAPHVPQAWLDQLADGGRIVVPVGDVTSQRLMVVDRQGQNYHRRQLCDVRFVKLIGKQGFNTD